MKKLVLVLGMLMTIPVAAQNNSSMVLGLPSAPVPFGQDRIRAGELDCQNAIGGATNLEFGVTGIVDNADPVFGSNDPTRPESRDIGVYARITIPLDKPKSRINCDDLYQLELRKKRLEVLKLQEELSALRKLNASNEGSAFEN